jgi:NitT/TauT family transport system substrate-binding protein
VTQTQKGHPIPMTQTRRSFLAGVSLVGGAVLARARTAVSASDELETTSVRLVNDTVICEAPLMAATELLKAEGFTDIRYVDITPTTPHAVGSALAAAKADFGLNFALFEIAALELGGQSVLAGVHIGCFELFARDDIRSIVGLKGKTVGLKRSPPDLLRLMALQVGLDPAKDINWVSGTDPQVRALDLFAMGKIDAFLGFPPEPQELRARGAGHVILNTAIDRPWSQYFCCTLVGNSDYVRKYPVATKRVVRAILKTADLCAADPAGIARRIVEGGFTPRYDYAVQTLTDVPYQNWRDFDIEDSLRFYALRMHEAGLITSTPQQIIAKGTDWRFLNELKRELKA